MIFEWKKVFPNPEDLECFRGDLYGLAKALYDLLECPQAYEDQTDFIVKFCVFVNNHQLALEYIKTLLEKEDENNQYKTGE